MRNSPFPEQDTVSDMAADIGRYAWLPIPVFLVLFGTLRLADMTVVWEPAFLLTLLNFVFSTTVSLFVSYLAALSFFRNASFTVLMLGCGTLFFGIVSLIAAVAIHFGQINIALTIHNIGVCFSGACHFLAAASTRRIDRRIERHAMLILAIAYASVLAVTGVLTFAAFEAMTPVFFIQGQGATPLRQAVLGTAVVLFTFSGLMIRYFFDGFHRQFARWYALSLGLIATGLFGVLVTTNVGSPLGWAGRSAQYLGGIYMLVAVLAAARKSGEWDAALQVALKESQERYRTLTEATFEGVVISENDVIVDVNEQFCRMLGCTEDDVIGKEIDYLIPDGDRQQGINSQPSDLNAVSAHTIVRKDGETIIVESRNRFTTRQGNRIRYSAIRDITAQKHSEDALRKLNETLEQRVAERTAVAETRALQLQQLALELTGTEDRERQQIALILHDDLQQCLAALRYHLQLLIPTETTADIDGMRQQIRKLEGLIDESMQKCRSLSHELSPPVLHESGLSAALAWLARDMQAKHGFQVDLDIDPDADPSSVALASLLFRSVRELLFNAVKHSGGSSAAVAAHSENNWISIRVADNGQGCDPALIQAKDGSMTGFGLFTIEERITFMGGRFEIRSGPGRGCCVTLQVPAQLSTPDRRRHLEPAAILSELGSEARHETEKIRILLADDHAVLRQGLSNILETQKDFAVVGQAVNGREAIQLAAELKPNVIMMDISMPEIGGIEATAEIKKRHPHIRVIGLSMHDDVDTKAKMLQAGAVAYIYKASPAAKLIEAIRSSAY